MTYELVVNAAAATFGLVVGYSVAYVQFGLRKLKVEQMAMQQQVTSIDREIHDGHQDASEEK